MRTIFVSLSILLQAMLDRQVPDEWLAEGVFAFGCSKKRFAEADPTLMPAWPVPWTDAQRAVFDKLARYVMQAEVDGRVLWIDPLSAPLRLSTFSTMVDTGRRPRRLVSAVTPRQGIGLIEILEDCATLEPPVRQAHVTNLQLVPWPLDAATLARANELVVNLVPGAPSFAAAKGAGTEPITNLGTLMALAGENVLVVGDLNVDPEA